MHYGPCSYYALGQVYPRKRLREYVRRIIRRFLILPRTAPQGPFAFVAAQAGFAFIPAGQISQQYVVAGQVCFVFLPAGQISQNYVAAGQVCFAFIAAGQVQ